MSVAMGERDAELDRILAAARHMAEKLNIRIDIDPEKAKLIDFSRSKTFVGSDGAVKEVA